MSKIKLVKDTQLRCLKLPTGKNRLSVQKSSMKHFINKVSAKIL